VTGHTPWRELKHKIDVETDEERDARHAPENDRIWGEGRWVRCSTCPRDATGREVYHHRNAHGDDHRLTENHLL
jgi:hypothetical protein